MPPGLWLAEAVGRRSTSTHTVPGDFGSQPVFLHGSVTHRCPTGSQGTTYQLPPAPGTPARRAGRWFLQSPSLPSPRSLHTPWPCLVGSSSSAQLCPSQGRSPAPLPVPSSAPLPGPAQHLGPALPGPPPAPGLPLPGELGALQTAPGYSH